MVLAARDVVLEGQRVGGHDDLLDVEHLLVAVDAEVLRQHAELRAEAELRARLQLLEVRSLQDHRLEAVGLVRAGIDELPHALHVGLEALLGQPQDQVRGGAQATPAHVHLDLLVGLELDVRAIDVAQHLVVEGLDRLVENQRAVHLLHRLDDPIGAVLARRRIDERGPAIAPLHLADVPGDLDVALVHAVVGIGDAQRAHVGRALVVDPRDVLDLLAHALLIEVVDLAVEPGALHTEGAAERAAAVGLDHGGELAVEELVHDPRQIGRGDLVHGLVPGQGLATLDGPIRGAPDARGQLAFEERGQRALHVEIGTHELAGEEIALAAGVHVQVGVGLDVGDLAVGLDRQVRAPHDRQDLGVDGLGAAQEGVPEGLVPDVVADHEHIRRSALHRVEEAIWIAEQARLHLRGIELAIHDGLDETDSERHAIRRKHASIVVA